jgi:hypothetical protein
LFAKANLFEKMKVCYLKKKIKIGLQEQLFLLSSACAEKIQANQDLQDRYA